MDERELTEAKQAADTALRALEEARACLGSARNWGVADILGGGFLTTMIKRGKMEDAEHCLMRARNAMNRLARELADLPDARLESGSFLEFADYFFDGAVADFLVQSRIKRTLEQTEEAIRQVRRVRERLRALG